MNWLLDALKTVVYGIREIRRAREADRDKALQGYAAGRSAHDAAANAGRPAEPRR